MTQTPCVRAASASAPWIGPSPGVSAIASLSRSARPRKQKYSGSATSSAPSPAAAAMRRRAASRLRSTLGVETICRAAIFIGVAPGNSEWRGTSVRSGGGHRRTIGGRDALRLLVLDALDLRVVPRPGDVELARARLDQRLPQEVLREEGADP